MKVSFECRHCDSFFSDLGFNIHYGLFIAQFYLSSRCSQFLIEKILYHFTAMHTNVLRLRSLPHIDNVYESIVCTFKLPLPLIGLWIALHNRFMMTNKQTITAYFNISFTFEYILCFVYRKTFCHCEALIAKQCCLCMHFFTYFFHRCMKLLRYEQ